MGAMGTRPQDCRRCARNPPSRAARVRTGRTACRRRRTGNRAEFCDRRRRADRSGIGWHVGGDRAGRVLVNNDLSLPEHPEVFVIGDLASLKDERGNLLPGVAPVAMQQGRYVGKTIAGDLHQSPRKNFHYFDKGSLATIGRAAAVAQMRNIHISGYFAWLAWLFIHIMFLIGFRNRLIVMIQWAWSYLTYERGARLITGDTSLPGWPVKTDTVKEREQEPVARN